MWSFGVRLLSIILAPHARSRCYLRSNLKQTSRRQESATAFTRLSLDPRSRPESTRDCALQPRLGNLPGAFGHISQIKAKKSSAFGRAFCVEKQSCERASFLKLSAHLLSLPADYLSPSLLLQLRPQSFQRPTAPSTEWVALSQRRVHRWPERVLPHVS